MDGWWTMKGAAGLVVTKIDTWSSEEQHGNIQPQSPALPLGFNGLLGVKDPVSAEIPGLSPCNCRFVSSDELNV